MKRIQLGLIFLLAAELLCAGRLGAQDDAANEKLDKPAELAPATKQDIKNRKRARARNARDLVATGHNVELKEGEITRDVVVIGGSATVDGIVQRDLVVVLGSAKLGPNADVKGDVVVVGGALETDPAAQIGRDRVVIGLGANLPALKWLRWPSEWFSKGLLWARPFPHQYLWAWVVAGLCLLVYLLVTVLFPRPVQACVAALESKPLSSFMLGLLSFLLVGPLLFLLICSVVGLVLLPFAGCALLVAFLFGKAAVYSHAGHQLGRQLGLGAMEKPVLALVVGTLIFYLLYAIPILGFVAWGAITCLAIGAAGLAFFNSFRSEAGAPPVRVGVVPPAAPVGGPPAPPPIPVPADPATLARVGFWGRFFATVLDLLVVGFAMRVLKTHALFVPAWLAYHIGMWAWKGATVGGLALGIRIVRHDGSPIDFAVALVRSLASFLSGAALFLGFFWAGWDREKQSWHDKIAGTIVVKYPKGVPLLASPNAPGPQSQSATP
jgi:uncharacterized RDD family membrane protein YckC